MGVGSNFFLLFMASYSTIPRGVFQAEKKTEVEGRGSFSGLTLEVT